MDAYDSIKRPALLCLLAGYRDSGLVGFLNLFDIVLGGSLARKGSEAVTFDHPIDN